MVTMGIFPCKEKSHGRTGNRTRDLMISSQRPWPLDHEAGEFESYTQFIITISNNNNNNNVSWMKGEETHFMDYLRVLL